MKNSTFKMKILKTLILYNILFLIVGTIFIKAIPKLLVYPPNSINTEFERHIDDGFYYNEQGGAIAIIALLVSNATFLLELRRIKGWEKYVDANLDSEEKIKKVIRIKRDCCTIPSKLYFYHAFVPTIITTLGLAFTRSKINFSCKTISCRINAIYYNWFVNICFF